jgi:hypothetical protein
MDILKGYFIKLLIFLAFTLVLPGVYAVEPSVYASGVDSTVGFTSEYSMPDSVAVTDSATLSFSNGPSLNRQITAAGTYGEGSGDFSDEQSTWNNKYPNATATVSVEILGSEWFDYTYTLDPKVPGTGTKPAKASENLDVTNAAHVLVYANAKSDKGDRANQGIQANSNAKTVCFVGYSNSAQADATSATASQSFKSLTGDSVSISSDAGYDKFDEKTGIGKTTSASTSLYAFENSDNPEVYHMIPNAAKEPISKATSAIGYDAPSAATVTNLKTTSTMKSETSPSSTFSVDSVAGGIIGYSASTYSGAWSNTQSNNLGSYITDQAYGATINKLSQTANVDAKSASVTSSYTSLSAANYYSYGGASNSVYAGGIYVGDYSNHGVSASGPVDEE